MLATKTFMRAERGVRTPPSLEPSDQTAQAVVRTGNDLDADNLSDLGRGGGAGVGGGLHARDVAAEERGHVTAPDFFPAGEGDVGGLERGVGGLEQRTEPLGFDHADCLISHERMTLVTLRVWGWRKPTS